MSRTITAIKGPVTTTICTMDGTPYRTDADGITYVAAGHVAEMTARTGIAAATNTDLAAGTHQHVGHTLTLKIENG